MSTQPFLRIQNHSLPNSSQNILPSTSSFPNSSSSPFSLFFTSHSSSPSSSSPISIFYNRAQGSLPCLTSLRQQRHLEISDSSSESPLSVDLIPISNDDQFDHLVAQTHQHPLVIVWMANWCRKWIYLKPKLEKLAAEHYPRLRFYNVDVNTVSHKLVARAGVTKMPTIQLWKDGNKQGEVISGHNAYWTIGDVQEMIENECTV